MSLYSVSVRIITGIFLLFRICGNCRCVTGKLCNGCCSIIVDVVIVDVIDEIIVDDGEVVVVVVNINNLFCTLGCGNNLCVIFFCDIGVAGKLAPLNNHFVIYK